jgi:hypothetical protein
LAIAAEMMTREACLGKIKKLWTCQKKFPAAGGTELL